MSVKVMSLVFDADMETSARNGVMLALADGACDRGRDTFKAVKTMAQMANVSERTVQRICQDFIKEGLIKIVGKGPRGTTRYDINIDVLKSLDPRHHVTPDTVSPPTPCRETPDTMSPEPSVTIPLKPIAKAIVKKKRRKPEVPIPDDWLPPALTDDFFAKHKYLTIEDIETEHDKFRNHAIANDRRQRDWNAAWRLWLGNANKWAKPKSKSTEQGYFEREQSDHDRAASAAIAALQRRSFE